ncbi:MAG: hypothetical protein K2W88_18070, partial [Pararheinheimera sp.]|nr:hypothetical protein [Rheinheimera sp.]
YSWVQKSGSTLTTAASGAKLTLNSVTTGSYSFEVTVSDAQLSSTAVVAVTVKDNQVTTEVKPKSGGAFGGWALLLLAAMTGLFIRRRTVSK